MTGAIAAKLAAILIAVGIGWGVGRARLLGGHDPARVLANAAIYIFVPALLFRTTARQDLHALPWVLLAAFFAPVLLQMFAVFALRRGGGVADPSVRAITAVFGNTLQVGIPVTAGVFGEAGLALHVTIVSLHALTILSVLTLLVELDLARAQRGVSVRATLVQTLKNTIIHPVVLPVVAGLSWHLTGFDIPPVFDEALQSLGTAVVPLCLTLIGMSLAQYGWPRAWRGMLGLVALKLFALPIMIFVVAHWGFGLTGLPLAVIVMMGALPVGSNALIFAQRYRSLEAETTAATVLSTLAYAATAPIWLAVLARISPW